MTVVLINLKFIFIFNILNIFQISPVVYNHVRQKYPKVNLSISEKLLDLVRERNSIKSGCSDINFRN